jgi:hypothetical protein
VTVAESFASALARKDKAALRAILATDIDFKGLTPRRFWEASTADEVLDVLLGSWFEADDHIDGIAALERGDDVEDVHRVAYRFDVTTPDGPHTVEQQAYYRESDGRLIYLRIVCSGFRPKLMVG